MFDYVMKFVNVILDDMTKHWNGFIRSIPIQINNTLMNIMCTNTEAHAITLLEKCVLFQLSCLTLIIIPKSMSQQQNMIQVLQIANFFPNIE